MSIGAHETVADIVAKMRRDCPTRHMDGTRYHDGDWVYTKGTVERLADRIEAAYRRERGDCPKERKALKHIKQWRGDCISEEGVDNVDDMMMTVDAALAAPARNCDVGTAEEQSKRLHAYCDQYGRYLDGSPKCNDCPLLIRMMKEGGRCELVWAQMPYEAGGVK